MKLSRDCTIQSKRVIFHLHRQPSGSDELLSQAKEKISSVISILKQIAQELLGEDPAQFHSAYTPGVQEFIEALSYYQFLKEQRLVSFEEVQVELTFRLDDPSPNFPDAVTYTTEEKEVNSKREEESSDMEWTSNQQPSVHLFPLKQLDYVLGVADLTGELMRLCVNVATGEDTQVVFCILRFVGCVYNNFLSLMPTHKEILRKIQTLRSSLIKIEKVCYTLKVRGSEIPRHMLVDIVNSAAQQDCTESLDS